ncbi:MAG: hypothetical protein IKE70_05875 [Bacilli bacterium]|nr:hypothetical protein [Bacilli bacterium]
MNDRIMFMVINDHVEYLKNNNYDHKEWYNTLGLDPNLYEKVIRGFIMNGKIIFFKGFNFNYDDEVIQCATRHATEMRKFLQNPNLEVWCGILANGLYGNKWETVYRVNDSDIQTYDDKILKEIEEKNKANIDKNKIEEKIVVSKLAESVITFKNDVKDERFIKTVILDSIITLIITILLKIILSFLKQFNLSNFGDFILIILQVGLIVATIVSYKKKAEYAKFIGVFAGLCLCFTFHIVDILLGIHYALFNIDYKIYVAIGDKIHTILEKFRKKK